MSQIHIGHRLRSLREQKGLKQKEVAEALGLSDHQPVSQIELGKRKVTAQELVRASQYFDVSLEWLTNPFILTSKNSFSWRQNNVTDENLNSFEEVAGEWIGAFRELNKINKTPLKQILPRLSLTYNSSLNDAVTAGEQVSEELNLGERPALSLSDALENRLGILVLMIDTVQGISGAACALQDLNAILINRKERPARRNTDLAHEFYHILTWMEMRPERKEAACHSQESPSTHKAKRNQKIERLADNFSAGLLMPQKTLNLLGKPHGNLTKWLIEGADYLGVSALSLKWRLVNSKVCPELKRISSEDIRENRAHENNPELPPLFSKKFLETIDLAIQHGHISIGKAAKLLNFPVDELGDLFEIHSINHPGRV